MVTSITSFGRSGLYDWMMQRVTALVLLAYTLYIITLLMFASEFTYAQWAALFSGTFMRIFTLMAILALVAHAWIGLWSVSTDYIKITSVRFVVQAFCGLLAFIYVVWGIQILWSV